MHVAERLAVLQRNLPDPAVGKRGCRRVGAYVTGVVVLVHHVHGHGAIAQQPLRAVDPVDAELLFGQEAGEARAVDEKVGFEALAALCQHGRDVAIFGHLHVGDVVEVVLHAARGTDLSQVVRELQRIHVVRELQRLAELRAPRGDRAQAEFTHDRLHGGRLPERDRAIAHVPAQSGAVDGLHAIRVECMVIMLALAMEPVDVLDGLLERAVDALQELDGVEPHDRENMFNVWDSCLADADAWNVRRFDQADLHRPAAVVPEGGFEVGRSHPAGRAAADNQYLTGSQFGKNL